MNEESKLFKKIYGLKKSYRSTVTSLWEKKSETDSFPKNGPEDEHMKPLSRPSNFQRSQ
jgi:hypothetical protein